MKFFLIITLSVLSLFSCERNQDIRQKKESRKQAINGCKNSQFVGAVLSKENVLNLFKCLGWHLELSSLYNQLEKISAQDWNLFAGPLNEVFFKESNHELRSELFSFFYKLEKNGSLDQLSSFLSNIDFKGVSDFVEVLFRCQKKGECSEYDLKVAKALVPNEESYERIILFLNYFKSSLSQHDSRQLVLNFSKFLEDQKIESFLFEILKNDDSLVFDDLSTKVLFPSVKEFIFEEKSGRSRLYEFSRQFEDKRKFSDYINNNLFSGVLKIAPTFRLVSKFNGTLPCQLGSEGDLSSFDLDYRLVNFIKRTIGPNPALGKNLIEETAFTLLANQLCANLPSFSSGLNRFNLYSSSPFHEVVETELVLGKFNSNLINILSNKYTHQLMSMFYGLVDPRVDSKTNLSDAFRFLNLQDTSLVYDFFEYSYKTHLDLFVTVEDIIYTSDLDLYFLSSYFLSKLEGNEEIKFLMNDLSRRLERKHLEFARNLSSQTFSYMENPKESINNFIEILNLSEDLPLVLESAWFENTGSLNSLIRFLTSTSKMLEDTEVKNDVSRLVSSRYLIRAIKLLSLGGTSGAPSVAEIVKGIKKISYVKSDKNFRQLMKDIRPEELSCVKALSSDEFSLTKILVGLPKECMELDAPGELLLILSEINELNLDTKNTNYQSYGGPLDLFNKELFGSTEIVGDGVLLLNTVFNLFYKNSEETKSNDIALFVRDLFDSFSKDEFISLSNSLVKLLKSYFDSDPLKQMYHRNYFLSDYLDDISPTGEKLRNYILGLSDHLIDFNNSFQGVTTEELSKYKSCDEYFIFWIGYDECQDATSISNSLHNVKKLLLRKNGVNRPTALEMLMKLALPKEGVEIPFEAENKRKVVFTAEEIIKMAVNVNDPNFTKDGKRINNQIIDFWLLNERGKKEKKKYLMTTSQRMETTVREVRFDLNYLGVSYMNTVARGENYTKTVKSNFKLLKRCALYFRYCLRFFSKQEHLMVRNGIATYPALWDLEDFWGHGEAMQGLITSLVASSSKKAAKADLINFRGFRIPSVPSDRELKKHNGSIFTQLSMISVFTNFGRVLDSRFEGYKNVRKFIESQDFSLFSQHFLKNITYKNSTELLNRVLTKSLNYRDQSNLTVTERIVDWISSRNKVQSLYIQNIVSDLVMISPFIGIDTDSFFGPDVWINPKYKKNSLDSVLVFLDDFMDVWSYLFDELDIERQESLLKGVNFVTSFLREGLYSSGLEKSLFFYETLNEVFYVANSYLYEFQYDQLKGVDYLKLSFYERSFLRELSASLNSMVDFIASFSKEDISDFLVKVQSLLKENEGKVSINFLSNVINIIRVGVTELSLVDEDAAENKNFNFYENLIRYLSVENEQGETKVNLFSKWLNSSKNRDAVNEVLQNFLGNISPSH